MHKSMQHIFATSFCAPQHAAYPPFPHPSAASKPWQITIETVPGEGAWLEAVACHDIAVNLWLIHTHTHTQKYFVHSYAHTACQTFSARIRYSGQGVDWGELETNVLEIFICIIFSVGFLFMHFFFYYSYAAQPAHRQRQQLQLQPRLQLLHVTAPSTPHKWKHVITHTYVCRVPLCREFFFWLPTDYRHGL